MKNIDILIFGGQSNMQGQTEVLSENEIVENALEYKMLSNTFVPLQNPVGESICYDGSEGNAPTKEGNPHEWLARHALGSACYGYTNLVPAFVRAYRKHIEKTVVAVHAAKGSTQIKDWLPGSLGYKMLVTKATAAVKKAAKEYCVDHIYFMWLQGESDAIAANSKDYYKESLKCLAQGLKTDVGVERFGMIRVGRFTNDQRDDEIITAQDEICQEEPFFSMLTTLATELNQDPVMMNPYVKGHYSAHGLEVLGEAAGDSLGKISFGG